MITCKSNALHTQSVTAIKRCNLAYLFVMCTVCLFSTSSYALEELATIDPLPPMERDTRSVGWEWHFVDQKGKPGHMRLIATDENTDTYYRTDGCTWTRPLAGFAPASQWSGCPSSGTSTVTLNSPSIWPLKVGHKFEWSMTGRSNLIKRKWSGFRQCEVLPSTRIKTVLGEFDTHKVHCEERWGSRTWWLSPKVGTAIAYQQVTKRGRILQEMTKLKP